MMRFLLIARLGIVIPLPGLTYAATTSWELRPLKAYTASRRQTGTGAAPDMCVTLKRQYRQEIAKGEFRAVWSKIPLIASHRVKWTRLSQNGLPANETVPVHSEEGAGADSLSVSHRDTVERPRLHSTSGRRQKVVFYRAEGTDASGRSISIIKRSFIEVNRGRFHAEILHSFAIASGLGINTRILTSFQGAGFVPFKYGSDIHFADPNSTTIVSPLSPGESEIRSDDSIFQLECELVDRSSKW